MERERRARASAPEFHMRKRRKLLSSAGSCSEAARQAEAPRTERPRRMQLQHEEQLALPYLT